VLIVSNEGPGPVYCALIATIASEVWYCESNERTMSVVNTRACVYFE
jgi:hypothetical protein